MRFTFHTSLLTLVFAIGATDVLAAPAVRQLNGGFTGPGSAGTSANAPSGNMVTKPSASSVPSGITSSRAGSIRTNSVRPSVTANPASNSGAMPSDGSNRSASTSQRLSIGSYIGAPQKISSGGGGDTTEITNDIKNINNEISNITNIVEGLETDISGKVDIAQGTQYTGKALVVDTQGNVKPIGEFVTQDELDVDLDGKVDKAQGIDAAGHVLSVDANGNVTNANEVYFKPEMDTKLAAKVDNFQGISKKGKALVVGNDGVLKPTGDFVDADQGAENHGRALVINDLGRVVPGDIDFTEFDLDGKVDKLQGTQHMNEVLIVGSNGKVTDQKIMNANVADNAALERRKMAADIVNTLDWVDTWKNQAEDSETGDYKLDSNARYVMALDEYGEKAWFKVIVTGNE